MIDEFPEHRRFDDTLFEYATAKDPELYFETAGHDARVSGFWRQEVRSGAGLREIKRRSSPSPQTIIILNYVILWRNEYY
jgi:hypothetical protein